MYDRVEFFDELEQYLEGAGVGAYATYEMSGEFDILLRAWLPGFQTSGRFADSIDHDLGLEDSRDFQVVDIVRHWVWSGEKTHEPEPCDHERLIDQFGMTDIETINRLSDESHCSDAANPSTGEAALVSRMMSGNGLADLRGTSGIRILVRLEGLYNLRTNGERHAALQLLTREVDKVTRPKGRRQVEPENGHFTIDEVSLYRCRDESLLLLCRVDYPRWHRIREDLLRPLAALPGVAQTTTWPALTQNFVRSRECLQPTAEMAKLIAVSEERERAERDDGESPEDQNGDGGLRTGPFEPPPPPPTPPGAMEFFDRHEDAQFEAKGSAFTRVEEWLSKEIETPEEKYLKESNGFFRDTIAKSVVAMLNSGGGVILIGVLERDRYAQHKSDRLRLRLSRFPANGRFHVIGLQDPIFRERGWDGFELKFNRLLKESIEGEIADIVQVSRDWYSEQTLAVVRVEPVEIGDGFYLREGNKAPRFMIRRGGSTDELKGRAVARYIDRRRQREQTGE
jgi:hypothetical protein